jgi:hypothetical protein
MTEAAPPLDDTRTYQQRMLAQANRIERALASASDRRVANVWEYTQSVIAVLVVMTTCGGVVALSTWDTDARLPPEWWTIVGLVIGFYFGRTRPPSTTPPARSGLERERTTDGAVAVPPPPPAH